MSNPSVSTSPLTQDQKIDRILMILEGSPHQAGLVERVDRTEEILNGKDGSMGLIHKVNFMWRAHVWIIGGVGTMFGSLITYMLKH